MTGAVALQRVAIAQSSVHTLQADAMFKPNLAE
jgi:hypothetical protein